MEYKLSQLHSTLISFHFEINTILNCLVEIFVRCLIHVQIEQLIFLFFGIVVFSSKQGLVQV